LSINDTAAYFRNGIGDFFIALPTVRALTEYFGHLDLICDNSAVLPLLARIPRVRVFDPSSDELPRRSILLSLNTWVGENLKTMYERCNSSEIVLPVLVNNNWHDSVFTVAQSVGVTSPIDLFAHLEEFGPIPEIKRQLGVVRIGVHLETKPQKCVSLEFAQSILASLTQDAPSSVIDFGTRNAPQLGDTDARGIPLMSSISVLRHVDVLVCVDSCLRHAADLLGIRTILLKPRSHSMQMFETRFTPGQTINEPHEVLARNGQG
jgi:ADP-heptose:LPS heptosyltransferase